MILKSKFRNYKIKIINREKVCKIAAESLLCPAGAGAGGRSREEVRLRRTEDPVS